MSISQRDTLNALRNGVANNQDRRVMQLQLAWIADAQPDEVTELLRGIAQLALQHALNESILTPVLRALSHRTALSHTMRSEPTPAPSAINTAIIAEIYERLPAESPSRHLLLSLLARQADADSLAAFAELLATNPPTHPESIMEACAPLWRQAGVDYSPLFPRLLDALEHPSAATIVLDFTNFLASRGHAEPHPADARREQLLGLFSRLIERLESFEELSVKHGVTDLDAAQQVNESVGLAIALCYALSLMKETAAIGQFYRMMDLRHRRLRVEAAAALARVGEKPGTETLVELAAEPSVRRTVLAYAAELGLLDQIHAQHRCALARAEAELVSLLAEPRFYGHPPNACDSIDSRRLSWPGHDQPVDCYLFRFTYRLPSGEQANIGIAGPLAFTFAADMTALSIPNLYAAFAGWHAEHEEIQELEIDPANLRQASEVKRWLRRLADEGFTNIEPEFLGVFFGERCLVAAADDDSRQGWVVVSDHEHLWIPRGNPLRPIPAEITFSIFKGQRLLRSFNEGFDAT